MEIEGVQFNLNKRLGLKIPEFKKEWHEFNKMEQSIICDLWEREKALIPERIFEMEKKIDEFQELMYKDAEDFFTIHLEIVDLASAINDLNILSRTDVEMDDKD